MEIGEAIDEEFGAEAEAAEIPVQRRIFWLFWRAVTMGRQASRTQQLRFIAKDRDWRARAWILERTAPEQFSRMEKLRVGQDPDAGPLRVVHEEADPDFISEVMRIYTEQGVVPGVDSGNGKRPARKRARKEA
jgi:hypothetical protein